MSKRRAGTVVRKMEYGHRTTIFQDIGSGSWQPAIGYLLFGPATANAK